MSNYPDFSSQGYQVVRELGRNREGGRISYLAEDCTAGQPVVIKQFRFAQENASWQGFKVYEREIAILQELNHTRIPRYLNSFETPDGFCMVQEYKDAPTLAHSRTFTAPAIYQIATSILEILVDLQNRVPPIFHRDIKPENILVDKNNQAYLIDFGLARVNSPELAMSSVMAGTPGFMPPEELFNRPLTMASDLYSLGATLIAVLTHTSALEISNLMDENYQFKFRQLVTGVNPDFIDWLQKMVAPHLKDRFGNAYFALQALRAIDITGVAKRRSQKDAQKWAAISCTLVSAIGLWQFFNLNASSDRTANTVIANSATIDAGSLTPAQKWYRQIKPSCNAVEVVTAMDRSPYPQTAEGAGYAASCYALAGRLDLADRTIQQLANSARGAAAAIVFDVGHPVADAGDDKSAGPIMDLVLKYWPNNYMALYHAGMSAYVLGEYPKATSHLEEFLRVYRQSDGWNAKAQSALKRMKQGIPADRSFAVHH